MTEKELTAIGIWCDNEYARIFNAWKRDSGVKSFQVKIDRKKDYTEFTIYTNRPGYMIGFKGKLVNKYKAILKEAINREVNIKFIETTYCF